MTRIITTSNLGNGFEIDTTKNKINIANDLDNVYGDGSPINQVTPQRIGQVYVDRQATFGAKRWLAEGLNNKQWKVIEGNTGILRVNSNNNLVGRMIEPKATESILENNTIGKHAKIDINRTGNIVTLQFMHWKKGSLALPYGLCPIYDVPINVFNISGVADIRIEYLMNSGAFPDNKTLDVWFDGLGCFATSYLTKETWIQSYNGFIKVKEV